jgi:NNP family nitrate/nitrite transporter-like MFS transporter
LLGGSEADLVDIEPTSFRRHPMRIFHLGWVALFVTSFVWLGSVALLPFVQKEMGLDADQIGSLLAGSLLATLLARLAAGWLCDLIGPRHTYASLLVLGAGALVGATMAHEYGALRLPWVAIGLVGAAIVVTQYHTSLVSAPRSLGAATAAATGWGLVGGGVAPVLVSIGAILLLALGAGTEWSWRMPMLVDALLCALTAVAYWVLTSDTPEGDFRELRRVGKLAPVDDLRGSFMRAARNHRVWTLSALYGVSFGLEVGAMSVAALYYFDRFAFELGAGGLVVLGIVVMNPLARTLGGAVADWFAARAGRRGRVTWLSLTLLGQGVTLVLLSRLGTLGWALGAMLVFSLFVQMAQGATLAMVPYLDRRAVGSVTGIVTAGGIAGAALATLLWGVQASSWPTVLLVLGILVVVGSGLVLAARLQEQVLLGKRAPVVPTIARPIG